MTPLPAVERAAQQLSKYLNEKYGVPLDDDLSDFFYDALLSQATPAPEPPVKVINAPTKTMQKRLEDAGYTFTPLAPSQPLGSAEAAAEEICDWITNEQAMDEHVSKLLVEHYVPDITAIIRKHLPEREGYVSVPLEPTEDMLEAACEAMATAKEAYIKRHKEIRASMPHVEWKYPVEASACSCWDKEYYAALIAAAPK